MGVPCQPPSSRSQGSQIEPPPPLRRGSTLVGILSTLASLGGRSPLFSCALRQRQTRALVQRPKGNSSIGRASVSKTEGCGFKSLLPCRLQTEAMKERSAWQTRKRWSRPQRRALPSCPTPAETSADPRSRTTGVNGAKAAEGGRRAADSQPDEGFENQQASRRDLGRYKAKSRASRRPARLRKALRRTSAIGRSSRSVRRPIKFVRQSIGELRKVVYPTGQQLINYFVVVLVFVLFVIAYVSLLDLGLGWAIFKIFS